MIEQDKKGTVTSRVMNNGYKLTVLFHINIQKTCPTKLCLSGRNYNSYLKYGTSLR